MEFIAITVGMLALIAVVLVLVGRGHPGSGADLVDWRPTRSFEDEAQLEAEDVEQMMAAQNEYRRRRGERELTADQLDEMVRTDEEVRRRGDWPEKDPGADPDRAGENGRDDASG